MPADPLRQKQLFDQALELPPEERAAFLDDACGADQELRARVEALLTSFAAADDFLREPGPAEAGSNERPGGIIGRYRLLQQIGEGGFGTVWMAEQQEPVRRKVALKVIKLGMDTRQVVARFEAERQALALMEHPNIAKVFDGGITPGGRPYFVMELIRGVPITDYCDQAELNTPARLELFQKVCHAVQHAHQKGVIHRDLKPSNILVTLHDGTPAPKVIDFGIAKATSVELTQKTLFTEFRQMVGTPEYMAPEQAELSGLDIDTRADVYSLGVVLYELLTGTKPFDMKMLLENGYLEMLRMIREDQPQKPSTRISTLGELIAVVARRRHSTPASLGRLLNGDLDWIVMKALEKERSRRYVSANDLSSDIGRHLQDEPVQARPPSAAYQLRKFVRRNRVGVAAGLLVAATALLGIYSYVAGRLAVAAQTVKVLQLSAVLQLQKLEREADDHLWPAVPDKIPALESWLQSARALEARFEESRQALEEATRNVRARSIDRAVLEDLVLNLERLRNGLLAEDAIMPDHGWSVPKRLAFAQRLEAEFSHGGRCAEAWAAVLPQIREAYPELPSLEPQVGLLPIGRGESGLWEFAHLATGDPAIRAENGKLVVSPDMGVVLVLIPGGTFTMGAQWEDPNGENFDPYSNGDLGPSEPEGPLVKVTLEPFFLSKFEFTQGQWERITASNPNLQLRGRWRQIAGDVPVSLLDWNQCSQITARIGLGLPSEEQWEYAARAGTTSIWSTGNDPETLGGYANILDPDAFAQVKGHVPEEPDSRFNDGFVSFAPVGSFEPNPWGLHDVHGNAWEGCSNAPYIYGSPPLDPSVTGSCMARGGGFWNATKLARSASRISARTGATAGYAGFRPMRAIDR